MFPIAETLKAQSENLQTSTLLFQRDRDYEPAWMKENFRNRQQVACENTQTKWLVLKKKTTTYVRILATIFWKRLVEWNLPILALASN